MRRSLAIPVLAAILGLLSIAAVALAGAGARSAGSRADRATAVPATRVWRVAVSPGPEDLTLLQLSFHASTLRPITQSSLRVGVRGPFGDDYLAVATPRFATPGVRQALVLVVNRPSPLLDPAAVRLRVAAWRSFGGPTINRLGDPFARPAADAPAALCDLRRHGEELTASGLRALGSRGAALSGFSAAGAVAEAYAAVCGLPYSASFRQLIRPAVPSLPAPESPSPAPTPPAPTPPEGKLPGEGCVPTPGYVCPASAGGVARSPGARGRA
ncbi:MAG: hypothetical protein ACRDKL_09295 [Solirubrobacteraceae bacterium]